MTRQINHRAFLMAKELLEVTAPCLRPEEYKVAFDEFFRICKETLEKYEIESARMQQLLRPGKN